MTESTAFIVTHESDQTRSEHNMSMSIIALTLTRALGREKFKVVRIHPNLLDYSLQSRYCDTVELCPDFYINEEKHLDFLKNLSSRYDGKRVLIPASDDCSLFLARHHEFLSQFFVVLNPDTQSMEQMKNKKLQYELATQANVPIPETWFPKSNDDIIKIAEEAKNFPYVVKPLEAQKWRLKEFDAVVSGKKAITVHNKEELINEYERISQFDNELMVQEIIEGDDINLYTFLSYSSEKNKPLAYCIRSKLRQSPVKFGYCTATVSCHNKTVEDQAVRLLQATGYRGIAGIEFKLDPKTNLYKLIEINTRPVNTTGTSIGCGVNLPVIAFRDAIGLNQDKVTDWEDGVIWIWLYQDFWAAKEMRSLNMITYKQWLKSLRGKRIHAIYSSDDLLPWWNYYSKIFKGLVKEKFQKYFKST